MPATQRACMACVRLCTDRCPSVCSAAPLRTVNPLVFVWVFVSGLLLADWHVLYHQGDVKLSEGSECQQVLSWSEEPDNEPSRKTAPGLVPEDITGASSLFMFSQSVMMQKKKNVYYMDWYIKWIVIDQSCRILLLGSCRAFWPVSKVVECQFTLSTWRPCFIYVTLLYIVLGDNTWMRHNDQFIFFRYVCYEQN